MDNDICRQNLYLEHSAKDRLDKLRSGALKYSTGAQRIHEEAVNTAQRGIERGVNTARNAASSARSGALRYGTAMQRAHEKAVNATQNAIEGGVNAVKNAPGKARMAWNTASAEFKEWKKNYNHDYYRSHKELWDKYSTAMQRAHEGAVKKAQAGIEFVAGAPKGVHEEAVKVAQRGIEKGVDTVKGIHKEAVDVAERAIEPLLNKAKDKANELKESAKEKAKSAISSAVQRGMESLKEVATNPETYKVISDVGKTIGQSIASELKDTDFSSLGRDILSAIKQGISQ